MKNGMVVVMVLAVFCFVPMHAVAEMRITPDGVTTPDNTASVWMGGSFNTGSEMNGPQGAAISGENDYTGDFQSYGGYFSAAGPIGTGVRGYGSGECSAGVSGVTSGESGYGVYGHATNSGDVPNIAGYFRAEGGFGTGVSGYAANSGNHTNYGGYFAAYGKTGRAVYGRAIHTGAGDNNVNYGGFFIADGKRGRGIRGEASGANGIGVIGIAKGANSTGVWGEGVNWDFYAAGSGNYGPDAAGGEYGPFTGAHEVIFAQSMPEAIIPGLIVSVTGKAGTRKDGNGNISISSTLPTVTLSTTARDKAVFGVIVSQSPLPEGHWYACEKGERFGVVNALGEGRVWVTDINGQIQAGDYITTSSITGYGQMQDDDLLHSYTLGKAIETIDWDQVAETIHHEGKTYRRYLLAVVYTSG